MSEQRGKDWFCMAVLAEIAAERSAQDSEWGGPEHDDEHSPEDWRRFIQKQVGRMHTNPMTTAITDLSNYRARLVAIAALSIAALEALDRREDVPHIEAHKHEGGEGW